MITFTPPFYNSQLAIISNTATVFINIEENEWYIDTSVQIIHFLPCTENKH